MDRRALLRLGGTVIGASVLAGCTSPEPTPTPASSPEPTAGGSTPTVTTASSPTPANRPSTPSPSPTPSLPAVRDRRSLPALMRERFGSRAPERRQRLARTADYTKYAVRYPSGDLSISGVLYLPRGRGPFPAVVLNHGYIDPARYFSGQGMPREQEYLARRGFVVLHTDYRGHAQSSRVSRLDLELRLGYARDALNAVAALKRLPEVDPDRTAMFGRSMGGAVTYNALVAAPGAVRAGVVWAPVSSSFTDNYRRWTAPERPSAADDLTERYGRPDDDVRFYADLSARTFFDRITEPVLIEHGTVDDTCPPRWSVTTRDLMRRAGVRVTLNRRRGEGHTFERGWPTAMKDTVTFLRRELGA